jgi:hypothetical protein
LLRPLARLKAGGLDVRLTGETLQRVT